MRTASGASMRTWRTLARPWRRSLSAAADDHNVILLAGDTDDALDQRYAFAFVGRLQVAPSGRSHFAPRTRLAVGPRAGKQSIQPAWHAVLLFRGVDHFLARQPNLLGNFREHILVKVAIAQYDAHPVGDVVTGAGILPGNGYHGHTAG
jgi:hypothetical protein